MKLTRQIIFLLSFLVCVNSCQKEESETISINKKQYKEQLKGFWLGQCIANWTGLITEMDKIGNLGNIKTGNFYTRKDWGSKDIPNIWGEKKDSLSDIIEFIFKDTNEIWGSDDDTDIEYMYQYLLLDNNTPNLTPLQIKNGWLKHIKSEEENYLWVSNQKAFDLMKKGILPPKTGSPENNEFYDMIDAQLTTEIFGLYAPTRPDIASKIAKLPIQTTANGNAEDIAQFYVKIHALASIGSISSTPNPILTKSIINNCAHEARKSLPDYYFPAKMYDYVYALYKSGIPWEQTRDSIYVRYQVKQMDGYSVTSRNLYCNGCFAAGINFAASLVSLFYGEGNLKETIKIGSLCGWDSDNPTATWGGLIGFVIGKKGIEDVFGRKFSNKFNIHRTRQNFPYDGIDNFDNMAENGIKVIEKLMLKEMEAKLNKEKTCWIIPFKSNN